MMEKILILLCQHYDAPSCTVGCCFVHVLAQELESIHSLKWNCKHFIVFQMVVLQHSRDVKNAGAIKK
jgi:hypothetical protein